MKNSIILTIAIAALINTNASYARSANGNGEAQPNVSEILQNGGGTTTSGSANNGGGSDSSSSAGGAASGAASSGGAGASGTTGGISSASTGGAGNGLQMQPPTTPPQQQQQQQQSASSQGQTTSSAQSGNPTQTASAVATPIAIAQDTHDNEIVTAKTTVKTALGTVTVTTVTFPNGVRDISVSVSDPSGTQSQILAAVFAALSKANPDATQAFSGAYAACVAVLQDANAQVQSAVAINMTLTNSNDSSGKVFGLSAIIDLGNQKINSDLNFNGTDPDKATTTGTVTTTGINGTNSYSANLTTNSANATAGTVGNTQVILPQPEIPAPTPYVPNGQNADPTNDIPDNTIDASTSKPVG